MAKLKFRAQQDNGSTPLPNIFIDHYLPTANPVYTVLYIYCYRHALNAGDGLSTVELAESLGILESDMLNAWNYWEKAGLVTLSRQKEELGIQFLPVAPTSADSGTAAPAPDDPQPLVLETRPQYTVQELELYKNNSEEIQRLFEAAENILGKLLNYNDLSTLFGFYDWLRLPVEVIEELLSHCAENGHRNLRYIEKAALDWAESGIRSLSDAKAHIQTFDKDFREILKAVGQSSRNPTKTEIAYMKKWLREYEMPLEIILEACDKTVMQLGKPKFSYTDKIITGWKEAGVASLEDINSLEEAFYKTKENPSGPAPAKGKKTAKNRFVNYSQRDWDYEKLEKLEMEYLEKSLT